MNMSNDSHKIKIIKNIQHIKLDLEKAMIMYRKAVVRGDNKEIECSNKKLILIRNHYELLMRELDTI